MNTRIKTTDAQRKTIEPHVKLAAAQLPADIRSGGEKLPLDYPKLYQIQAGDWRISYAVEHNRLAILVLEVLNPEGISSKDVVQANINQKMKIKLLDWPEGAGSTHLPPEEVSKKMKIKWMDLAEDFDIRQAEGTRSASRIKLKGTSENKAPGNRKITLLEGVAEDPKQDVHNDEPETDDPGDPDRKITPLDEPTM